MADDAGLMAALAGGDDDALATVARRLSTPARAVAARIAGVDAVDDVVQETLLRVWRHAARFDASRGTLEAWGVRIARNAAIAHVRRARLGRRRDAGPDEVERIADRHVGPDVVVEAAEAACAVRDAVARLRPERRAAVECVLGGHTLIAAAAVLGVPEGTLKSRVRAAYADLRAEPPLAALVG